MFGKDLGQIETVMVDTDSWRFTKMDADEYR